MAENETTKPMPEEPEGAVGEGVQHGEESLRAEDHEITVILPDDDSVEDTEEHGQVEADVTETVPLGSVEEGDDVFVLLPDGDDEAIPLVETEEVDATEVVGATEAVATESLDGPALESAFESASSVPGAGLRTDNPLEADDEGDTEQLYGEEPTENCLIAEEPTDPMGPDDLEYLASEVADDFITGDSVAPGSRPSADLGSEEPDDYDAVLDDEFEVTAARRGGSGKWVALLATAAAAAISTWVWFPEYLGLSPTGTPVAVATTGSGTPVPGNDVGVPDPVPTGVPGRDGSAGGEPDSGGVTGAGGEQPGDAVNAEVALLARRTFRARFSSAIELGFTGEVSR